MVCALSNLIIATKTKVIIVSFKKVKEVGGSPAVKKCLDFAIPSNLISGKNSLYHQNKKWAFNFEYI